MNACSNSTFPHGAGPGEHCEWGKKDKEVNIGLFNTLTVLHKMCGAILLSLFAHSGFEITTL